jgi:hypothetical protein
MSAALVAHTAYLISFQSLLPGKSASEVGYRLANKYMHQSSEAFPGLGHEYR